MFNTNLMSWYLISRTYVKARYDRAIHRPSTHNWEVLAGRDKRTTWNFIGQLSWSSSFSDENQADLAWKQCGWWKLMPENCPPTYTSEQLPLVYLYTHKHNHTYHTHVYTPTHTEITNKSKRKLDKMCMSVELYKLIQGEYR